MPDPLHHAIAVGAALDWELRAVLAALGETRRVRRGDLAVWQGRRGAQRVLLYRTGVGVDAAARRTSALLAAGGVAALINTGCAGGIGAELGAGAVVVADAIVGPLPDRTRYATDPALAARLRAAATRAGTAPGGGTILTSTSPLLSAASKRQHRAVDDDAAAVDMESAAVAAAAAARRMPMASLRAILDSADTDLPADVLLPARERMARALKDAARDPGAALSIARLGLAQRAAYSAIEASFRGFFRELDRDSLFV